MSVITKEEESAKWVEVYKLKAKAKRHYEDAFLFGQTEPHITMYIQCESEIGDILFQLQSHYFAKEKEEKHK